MKDEKNRTKCFGNCPITWKSGRPMQQRKHCRPEKGLFHDERFNDVECLLMISPWTKVRGSLFLNRMKAPLNRIFLTVSIFRWGNFKGFLKCNTETVVSMEADFGSDLIDGVIGFFEELFGSC